MILAGVLLKLGTYGFVRYNGGYLVGSMMYYGGLVKVMCLVGIVYTSLIAIRQIDMKRVIAYGSIGHMGMVILGIVSGTIEGYSGSLMQMISHGVVSGGLFAMVGMVYTRVGSRNVWYMSGLSGIVSNNIVINVYVNFR